MLKQDISSSKQVKFKPGNKFTANALKKIQPNSQRIDFMQKAKQRISMSGAIKSQSSLFKNA